MWRLSEDVDLGGSFIFPEGLLSHWQVWIAAAVATQYGAWRLTRYARLARVRRMPAEESSDSKAQSGVAAEV